MYKKLQRSYARPTKAFKRLRWNFQFFYGFRRYVVVIFLVISHTIAYMQSYKEFLRWQSFILGNAVIFVHAQIS